VVAERVIPNLVRSPDQLGKAAVSLKAVIKLDMSGKQRAQVWCAALAAAAPTTLAIAELIRIIMGR
jgi:hypothetical protein